MDTAQIGQSLKPYLGEEELNQNQLASISSYIDLLMKWNARMNLTAVRDPEQMVRRHFGESLFAARQLVAKDSTIAAADLGSGAGFPGVPFAIYAPGMRVTLIESHGKKATFLREVCRAIALINVNIFSGRAEAWGKTADLVTLRAIEKFEQMLPLAAGLVAPGGRLALLIGVGQISRAEQLLSGTWSDALPIPESRERVLRMWKRA